MSRRPARSIEDASDRVPRASSGLSKTKREPAAVEEPSRSTLVIAFLCAAPADENLLCAHIARAVGKGHHVIRLELAALGSARCEVARRTIDPMEDQVGAALDVLEDLDAEYVVLVGRWSARRVALEIASNYPGVLGALNISSPDDERDSNLSDDEPSDRSASSKSPVRHPRTHAYDARCLEETLSSLHMLERFLDDARALAKARERAPYLTYSG